MNPFKLLRKLRRDSKTVQLYGKKQKADSDKLGWLKQETEDSNTIQSDIDDLTDGCVDFLVGSDKTNKTNKKNKKKVSFDLRPRYADATCGPLNAYYYKDDGVEKSELRCTRTDMMWREHRDDALLKKVEVKKHIGHLKCYLQQQNDEEDWI